MQRLGKFAPFTGAVLAQLLRYIFGNVADPAFGEVESNRCPADSVGDHSRRRSLPWRAHWLAFGLRCGWIILITDLRFYAPNPS